MTTTQTLRNLEEMIGSVTLLLSQLQTVYRDLDHYNEMRKTTVDRLILSSLDVSLYSTQVDAERLLKEITKLLPVTSVPSKIIGQNEIEEFRMKVGLSPLAKSSTP